MHRGKTNLEFWWQKDDLYPSFTQTGWTEGKGGGKGDGQRETGGWKREWEVSKRLENNNFGYIYVSMACRKPCEVLRFRAAELDLSLATNIRVSRGLWGSGHILLVLDCVLFFLSSAAAESSGMEVRVGVSPRSAPDPQCLGCTLCCRAANSSRTHIDKNTFSGHRFSTFSIIALCVISPQ